SSISRTSTPAREGQRRIKPRMKLIKQSRTIDSRGEFPSLPDLHGIRIISCPSRNWDLIRLIRLADVSSVDIVSCLPFFGSSCSSRPPAQILRTRPPWFPRFRASSTHYSNSPSGPTPPSGTPPNPSPPSPPPPPQA